MSRIWGILVGLCAIVGVGAIIFFFSGARGKVAKDKLLDKIDSVLGKDEIKRKEIAEGIEGYEKAVRTLTKAKVRATVEAEEVAKEVKANEIKLKESTEALAQLNTHLKKFETEAKYSVTVGSKTYTKAEDLDKMAKTVLEHCKTLKKQTETLQQRLENYQQIATTMTTRADEAKTKLQALKDELKDLDANIAQAKAYREAATALRETDKTFGENVQDLETKIKDLKTSVKTSVRLEEGELKSLTSPADDIPDAAKIIKEANSKSTISEIDSFLGNK